MLVSAEAVRDSPQFSEEFSRLQRGDVVAVVYRPVHGQAESRQVRIGTLREREPTDSEMEWEWLRVTEDEQPVDRNEEFTVCYDFAVENPVLRTGKNNKRVGREVALFRRDSS